MSAGTAQLLRAGRGGEISANGITYEADYQVITTDKSDGPAIVALASGIPRYGDIYSVGNELDFGVNCKSVVPRQDGDSPYKWIVHVVWAAEPGTDPQNINPNPNLRPPIVRWLREEYKEIIIRDSAGTLVANSNKEIFDPPIEVTRYRPVVHIERNFLVFNDSLQFTYLDAVNSDVWLTGAVRTWRCRQLQVDPMFERNVRYKRVTAEMVYKYDEWTEVRANVGYMVRLTTSTTAVPLPAWRKKPVPLSAATSILGMETTDLNYLTFYPHQSQPFNALGLI